MSKEIKEGAKQTNNWIGKLLDGLDPGTKAFATEGFTEQKLVSMNAAYLKDYLTLAAVKDPSNIESSVVLAKARFDNMIVGSKKLMQHPEFKEVVSDAKKLAAAVISHKSGPQIDFAAAAEKSAMERHTLLEQHSQLFRANLMTEIKADILKLNQSSEKEIGLVQGQDISFNKEHSESKTNAQGVTLD